MKRSLKAIATILVAATNAKALDQAVVMTRADLQKFEVCTGQKGMEQRLMSLGIIISTNKSGVFVLNEAALSRLENEQIIQLISDLVIWLTDESLKPAEKKASQMQPSTQDYKL